MNRRVLVTTGNGMFGRALIRQLREREDVQVRAMVRDPAKFTLTGHNLRVVTADMDDPASLAEPMKDVSHVFLTTPMDTHIEQRETAVIDAARAAGSPHVVVIYGAVRHEGDALDRMHVAALEHLKASGLPWTMVSPNSVMETSLDAFAEQIPTGVVLGMSGRGKVGLVALADVARVLTTVVTSDGHEGRNYECTGPAAQDMPSVVESFADVLQRPIQYVDLPEDEFARLLLKHGVAPDRQTLELQVLLHLRAWRDGRADLVTDTVSKVTGAPAMPVRQWITANRERFAARPSLGQRAAGIALRAQYRKYVLAPE